MAAVKPCRLFHVASVHTSERVTCPSLAGPTHPELPQLPPFNEVANEQAKVADLALDQAAIPSVVPVPCG